MKTKSPIKAANHYRSKKAAKNKSKWKRFSKGKRSMECCSYNKIGSGLKQEKEGSICELLELINHG